MHLIFNLVLFKKITILDYYNFRTFQNLLNPSGKFICLFFKNHLNVTLLQLKSSHLLNKEWKLQLSEHGCKMVELSFANPLLSRFYYSRIQNIVKNIVISTKICSYIIIIYDLLSHKINILLL